MSRHSQMNINQIQLRKKECVCVYIGPVHEELHLGYENEYMMNSEYEDGHICIYV